MPRWIEQASVIEAAGHPPKRIAEYIGRVNSGTSEVSLARMSSPPGWKEPGQTPQFNEYTLVLEGELCVRHKDGEIVVKAGQAIITEAGEWVRYSTPSGAEYIAVCVPAFSPDTVHRDA